MKQMLEEQARRYESIQKMYQIGKYTWKEPLIIVDPYQVCPLSALMLFHMEEKGELELDVEGIQGRFNFTQGMNEVPILGLKAGRNNKVQVVIRQDNKEEHHTLFVETKPLPEDYPKIEVKVQNKEKMAKGLLALSLGKAEAVKTTVPLYSIIDEGGEVRWLYTKMTAHVFSQLKNGRIIVDAPVSSGICGAYTSAGFIEMDFVGKIIAFYPIPNGLHHDAYELPNGNFLAITQRENTKQDLVVEIDRETRAIIKEWGFRQILDPTRLTVIDKVSVNHPLDWLHLNAVIYDQKDNAIIASSRNQSCVVKIDKDTSRIHWIIAPREGWNETLKPYVLEPTDATILSWAPHTPILGENGELLLFDNGNFRSYDLEKAKHAYENYSRGIAYKIDEETRSYKKVWSYGEERGNALYCPYLGAIRLLENGNRLICFGGITKDIFGGPTDDMKSNRMKNQVTIVEVTGDEVPEIAFEIGIKDTNIRTADGYKCYRSEKMWLYNSVDTL